MEVHGDESVKSSDRHEVSHQLGADGDTWFVLSVLASPTEVRNDRNDLIGGCSFGGIHHKEKFHEIVTVWEGGLNQENLASADRFLKRNSKFTVSEVGNVHLAQFTAETVANLLGERL